MDESRAPQAEIAALLGAIERLAADLALGEEPSRFIAALTSERTKGEGTGRPS